MRTVEKVTRSPVFRIGGMAPPLDELLLHVYMESTCTYAPRLWHSAWRNRESATHRALHLVGRICIPGFSVKSVQIIS